VQIIEAAVVRGTSKCVVDYLATFNRLAGDLGVKEVANNYLYAKTLKKRAILPRHNDTTDLLA
jgi:hypothetical protein